MSEQPITPPVDSDVPMSDLPSQTTPQPTISEPPPPGPSASPPPTPDPTMPGGPFAGAKVDIENSDTDDELLESQRLPRARKAKKPQHSTHWTSQVDAMDDSHPAFAQTKPLPRMGQMLFASQRIIPPRHQMGSPTDNNELSDDEGPAKITYRRTFFTSEDPSPSQDDYDEDTYVRKEEFQESNYQIRSDINLGFENVLSAMGDIASTVRRLATVASHSAEPRVRQYYTRPHKMTSVPTRRMPHANQRAKKVREHIITLVGGQDKLLIPMVNEREARNFSLAWEAGNKGVTTPPCCTISTFRFDILGFPKSPWNLSAARVFCQSFIPEVERSPETIKAVTAAFLARVKSLRQTYQTSQATSTARMRGARMARRNTRKYQLFQRRHTIARLAPELFNNHLDMLERLGVDGMSSDESDVDDLPRVRRTRVSFQVLTPQWRDPALTDWLHTFDAVAWVQRRDRGPTRGEHPRNRRYNHRLPKFSNSKKYVPGLPINAYNKEWLNARLDVDFAVCPDRHPYDFTHEPNVTAYLRAPMFMEEQ